MSIKHPTSGGQACDQEAAVQRTFHFVRSSFFYLSALMVRTQHSTYYIACILHTAVLNTDPNSCPPEVKPHPMKTIYSCDTRPSQQEATELQIPQTKTDLPHSYWQTFCYGASIICSAPCHLTGRTFQSSGRLLVPTCQISSFLYTVCTMCQLSFVVLQVVECSDDSLNHLVSAAAKRLQNALSCQSQQYCTGFHYQFTLMILSW